MASKYNVVDGFGLIGFLGCILEQENPKSSNKK
jgi:hypothetical protein